MYVAACVAGDGYVGLAALPDPGVAVDSLYEDGVAVSADASPYLRGEPGACSLGYSFEEPGVASAEFGVVGVDLFGLPVEYAYALLGDFVVASSAHFCVCLVSHRVYKHIVCLFGRKRGGAARLARGAHNPKVGSSNLPPATILLAVRVLCVDPLPPILVFGWLPCFSCWFSVLGLFLGLFCVCSGSEWLLVGCCSA